MKFALTLAESGETGESISTNSPPKPSYQDSIPTIIGVVILIDDLLGPRNGYLNGHIQGALVLAEVL